MKRLYHLDSFRIFNKSKFYSGLRQYIPKFRITAVFFYFLRIPAVPLFCIAGCFFTIYLNAQQPTQEWVARYTGPSNDSRGPFLALDKQGNSYLAGTHVINDSINILVAKYSQTGVLIWDKLYRYPGEGYFAPMGFALDTLGNAYVIARYGQNTSSFHNTLTVKFSSANGAVLWAQRYIGSPRHNIPEDIKIDRNNNIYVVGSSDSAFLVIKYDTEGDSIWVRKYQPPGFSSASACTIDDSLNIIMTGTRTHCVSMPPPGACFDTLLAIKYSQNGELRWAKTYFYPGNPTFNYGTRITHDQLGNVYIGGRTRPNIGTYKYLTVKYDRNGSFNWVSLYDGPGNSNESFREIAFDRINNSVFVTGTSPHLINSSVCATIKYDAFSGDSIWVRRDTGSYMYGNSNDIEIDSTGASYITGVTGITAGAVDILTIKYLSNGILDWYVSYNGPANGLDIGRELKIDMFRNIFVCGSSQGDYVIIKYNQVSGIHLLSNEIPSVFNLSQNYPNPFNPVTKINISVPKRSYVRLLVYDILGRQRETLINQVLLPAEYEVTFNSSEYSSGAYFYQLIADGSIIDTKKFVVLK